MATPTQLARWTPDAIRELRDCRDQIQATFGLELWATTPEQAQKRVSRLETGGHPPSHAVIRTLERMRKGEI